MKKISFSQRKVFFSAHPFFKAKTGWGLYGENVVVVIINAYKNRKFREKTNI